MKASQILKKIQSHKDALSKDHRVKALFLFGSVARGEATSKSDVDILVEFSSQDVGLFEFLRLKDFLESILERHVDLVTRDAVKAWMKSEVERDLIRAA
jgi:predicted nucleotidyltransferase